MPKEVKKLILDFKKYPAVRCGWLAARSLIPRSLLIIMLIEDHPATAMTSSSIVDEW